MWRSSLGSSRNKMREYGEIRVDRDELDKFTRALASCEETHGIVPDDPLFLRFSDLMDRKEAGSLTRE
jgi:hypothetical protein